MKKILATIAVLGLIALPSYADVKKATLIKGSSKVVVEVGSSLAKEYFSKGYSLQTKVGASMTNSFQSVSVLATSTTAGGSVIVLPRASSRQWAVITNTGATIAYLAFDNTSTSTLISNSDYAIPLLANGGSYTINLDNLYMGRIVATSSAAVSIRAVYR